MGQGNSCRRRRLCLSLRWVRGGFRRVNGQFRGFWVIYEDSIEEGCFFSFLHVVIISRGISIGYSKDCGESG